MIVASARTLSRLTMCTHLAATSEKLCPGAETTRSPPRSCRRDVARKEIFDRRASSFALEVATCRLRAIPKDAQCPARILEPAVEGGELLVPHQHQEMDFRQIRRMRGIKAAGAVLDGVGAVEGQRCASFERDALQGLGRQAFDGVAIQRVDGRGDGFNHGCWPFGYFGALWLCSPFFRGRSALYPVRMRCKPDARNGVWVNAANGLT